MAQHEAKFTYQPNVDKTSYPSNAHFCCFVTPVCLLVKFICVVNQIIIVSCLFGFADLYTLWYWSDAVLIKSLYIYILQWIIDLYHPVSPYTRYIVWVLIRRLPACLILWLEGVVPVSVLGLYLSSESHPPLFFFFFYFYSCSYSCSFFLHKY